MLSRSLLRLSLVFLSGTCVLLYEARPAFAQQQDAEKRVRSMNKQAMADYDALEFELSRKTLMDAVSLVRQSGLEESPVAAKTYLNLGVVYVAGFKDRNRGLQQFVQALKINPAIKLDPALASPELDEVFAAARKQVGVAAPPHENPPHEVAPEPDATPHGGGDEAKGLTHVPVEEARPGEPIIIKARLGSDTGASRMYVLYRSSGQADYTPLAMKSEGGVEWVGVIPGDVIEDRPLQYYVEARDKKGRAVVGSGSAPNPYIVMLSESAPGARIVRPSEKKKEDDKSKFHRLFVFVMPGFGIGYHPAGNQTEVAWQIKSSGASSGQYQRTAVDSPGGVAIAPFHLGVEIGGMITRGFSLSLLGRFELVTGANAQTVQTETGATPMGGTTRAGGAVAGFLRARYRFMGGKFHPYVHVSIGAGEIRHALNLSSAWRQDNPLVDEATAVTYNNALPQMPNLDRQLVCTGAANCYDSLKMGLVFVGGGGGLWYDVWKYIGLILDVNVLGGIAVGNGGQSGMNIDVQLGVGAHFL